MSSKKHEQENKQTFSYKLSENEIFDFIIDRFDELKLNPSMENLVHFHTINKFLIMSHSSKYLNKLGNLVANHNHQPFQDILESYEKYLKESIEIQPTIGSHTNVLSHIFGHFSNELNPDEKSAFLSSMKNFREKKISLSEVLGLLKSWVSKFDKTYLIGQTYFLIYYDPPHDEIFNSSNLE